MNPLARLIFPALRWHERTGYRHERLRIASDLKLGVGGFILFGGTADAAQKLAAELRAGAPHPLLIGSDFERGAGQQFGGLTHLPPPAALGFLNDAEVTRRCGDITVHEARSVGVSYDPISGDGENTQ